MPLPTPEPRTHAHTRDVVYRGFQREDRLWDIEAEMCDTKTHAMDIPGEGTWLPGEPIHRLSIRVTIDDGFVVREIAVAMDDVPHPECPIAQAPMQKMIGCTMGPGWRHAIQTNLGGARGCTHLRELLFNMATIAFQTLPEGPLPDAIDGSPPHFVGQCLAWDVNGSVVRRHYPAFVGWQPKAAGN